MKLEKFVEESLKQIIGGVIKAKKYAEENDSSINPINTKFNPNIVTAIYDLDTGVLLQNIDFDIAVSVLESNGSTTSKGETIGDISVSTPYQEENKSNSSISRIKFSVPVRLPTSGDKLKSNWTVKSVK